MLPPQACRRARKRDCTAPRNDLQRRLLKTLIPPRRAERPRPPPSGGRARRDRVLRGVRRDRRPERPYQAAQTPFPQSTAGRTPSSFITINNPTVERKEVYSNAGRRTRTPGKSDMCAEGHRVLDAVRVLHGHRQHAVGEEVHLGGQVAAQVPAVGQERLCKGEPRPDTYRAARARPARRSRSWPRT